MGMIVESAIGSFYQSLKQESALALMCGQFGLDYDSLHKEECQRALKKYLKY